MKTTYEQKMINKLLEDKDCRLFYDNPRSGRLVVGGERFLEKCMKRYEERLNRISLDRLEEEFENLQWRIVTATIIPTKPHKND